MQKRILTQEYGSRIHNCTENKGSVIANIHFKTNNTNMFNTIRDRRDIAN